MYVRYEFCYVKWFPLFLLSLAYIIENNFLLIFLRRLKSSTPRSVRHIYKVKQLCGLLLIRLLVQHLKQDVCLLNDSNQSAIYRL